MKIMIFKKELIEDWKDYPWIHNLDGDEIIFNDDESIAIHRGYEISKDWCVDKDEQEYYDIYKDRVLSQFDDEIRIIGVDVASIEIKEWKIENDK